MLVKFLAERRILTSLNMSKLFEVVTVKEAITFSSAESISKVEIKYDKEAETEDKVIKVKRSRANLSHPPRFKTS